MAPADEGTNAATASRSIANEGVAADDRRFSARVSVVHPGGRNRSPSRLRAKSSRKADERLKDFRALAWDFDGQVRAFVELLPTEVSAEPLIFLVSLNRPAALAIDRSVTSVKADAAIRLFNIRCNRITWAIVDSGIDARHPAFRVRDKGGKLTAVPRGQDASSYSRVKRTFDFTRIRALLNPMGSEAVI